MNDAGQRENGDIGKLFKTRAVQKGFQLIDHAVSDGTIGMGIAHPGGQKSYCVKAWRARHSAEGLNRVRHIWVEADVLTSPRPLLSAFCAAFNLSKLKTMSATKEKLAQKLAEDPVLIIVDEADLLSIRTFDFMRSLWDQVANLRNTDGESAFPLVLFGTPELRSKLERPDLERLRRRVAEVVTLDPLSRKELESVLVGKWPQAKVEDNAIQALLELTQGSFGWLNRYMHNAVRLAARDGGVITPRILTGARKYLLGVEQPSTD